MLDDHLRPAEDAQLALEVGDEQPVVAVAREVDHLQKNIIRLSGGRKWSCTVDAKEKQRTKNDGHVRAPPLLG